MQLGNTCFRCSICNIKYVENCVSNSWWRLIRVWCRQTLANNLRASCRLQRHFCHNNEFHYRGICNNVVGIFVGIFLKVVLHVNVDMATGNLNVWKFLCGIKIQLKFMKHCLRHCTRRPLSVAQVVTLQWTSCHPNNKNVGNSSMSNFGVFHIYFRCRFSSQHNTSGV